jgi:PAS domain S-box-containing protein
VNDKPDDLTSRAGRGDGTDDALITSEQRFRDVFENASLGMIEIDAEWIIRNANRAYANILGRDLNELIGTSCLALTHPDDIVRSEAALREAASSTSGSVRFEKRYLASDGGGISIRSFPARRTPPLPQDR